MKISQERLGAFTDAIIAIAATVMALELVSPPHKLAYCRNDLPSSLM